MSKFETKQDRTPQIKFNNETKEFTNVETGQTVGQIAMRVVTTVREPLFVGTGGNGSIGDIIDDMLINAALEGDDIESISVELQPNEWTIIRETMQKAQRDA